jgi:pyoverdine/dityrosine biosynthesis protein Dit1
MGLFGEPPNAIDEHFKTQHGLIGLCRGFSKFVLEDTLQHPSLVNLSSFKRRRVAWETAKLMILRNQAYSKLVETCFPAAVRLSIHPHNNAGPKFPINLIHPQFRGNSPGSTGDRGLFHIPTPWHNVTLALPDGGFAMTKHYMLQNLAQSDHQVVLVRPPSPAEGAYFKLVL